MRLSEASKLWLGYHRAHSKANSIRAYQALVVLRRHAATYASRSGVPIEIISKVILRHANLSTTERYLGKISDTEAMRWIDNLYA